MINLSILLPARNEEGNLENIVKETLIVLNSFEPNFEIILINDASTDRTLTIAQKLSSLDGKIKVIDNKEWKGLGFAIKLGIAAANGQYLLSFLPADSFPPQYIKTLYDGRHEGDVIVGFRPTLTPSGTKRIIISKIFKVLNRIVTGLKLKDYSWVHLYKKELVDRMKIKSDGIYFAIEMLSLAHKMNAKIIEVETGFRKREKGTTKTANLKVILVSIKEMAHIYLALK